MITSAKALPHKTMEDWAQVLRADSMTVVISILDPGTPRIFPVDTPRILTLKFSDLTIPYPGHIYPKREHAEEIFRLIARHHAETRHMRLMVNCAAGVSRSGAVVTFAKEYCGIADDVFCQDNPCICPNPLLLRLLREVELKARES